jgi:hypothetical protein
MSNGAIIMAVFSMTALWGGFAICLGIAIKSD